MKKYIKVFSGNSADSLEDEINKWIEENNIQVRDIKFQDVQGTIDNYGYCTVIVIYRKILTNQKELEANGY